MGEPLKDKAKVMPRGTKLQLPHKEAKIASCHMYYFKEEDVKSAVEWLREDIEKMFEREYCDGKNDKSCKKVLRKINKAFLDVNTNNSNKGKEE